MKKETKKLLDRILQEERQGNVCLMTPDGIIKARLDDLIKQPTEGILYDLNRSREVVMQFLDDSKWVNDYAVGLVIAALKDRIEELEG